MTDVPNAETLVDQNGMIDTLEQYDRCLEYTVQDSGSITVKSGVHPHWRRFQRDLHGPTVNIQGHGYAVEHVHKRKMLNQEMKDDPDAPCPLCTDLDYENKPDMCIVTLTPMFQLLKEGIEGPEVRA